MTDYRALLKELESERSATESELERLKRRYAHLHGAIAIIAEKVNAVDQPDHSVVTPAAPTSFESMTMPDAIKHCLSGGPLSKRELMKMLRDGGKEEGNHFSQGVYNTLYRLSTKDLVRKSKDGRWSLVRHTPVAVA